MPGGSTIRQCPHCLQKINCANRKCTKLLEIKSRQTARMKSFRARAKEWAQQVKKSRNQAKIFDNSALLVEKLKALGYFPLLLWGKYRPQNKKWNAQLQCPFELPLVAHAVLEKILCLFEGLLEACDPQSEEVLQQERPGENDTERDVINNEDQSGQEEQHEVEIEDQRGQEEQHEVEIEDQRGQEEQHETDIEDQRGQEEQHEIGETEMTDMQEMEIAQAHEDRVESKREERGEMEGQKEYDELRQMGTEVMEADNEREKTEEVGKKKSKAKKKEVAAANRKSAAVQILSKKKENRRRRNKDDACQYHSTLDIFPVQYVSQTREKKGCKEVLVHWLPCPSCQKVWPPSWEPQENIKMTLS
nr:putative uncharacterized protein DDB_G0287113 isoform X2 [Misgurnus anguillicaudatus]